MSAFCAFTSTYNVRPNAIATSVDNGYHVCRS